MNKTDRGALLTVFLVVLIDLLGFGIILPLLPFFASRFDVSPVMIGLLYSVYSFAQLIFSPIWGRISDRIGRRPVMLVSTFGAAAAYVLFAFSHNFALLFFSRLLAGIMGGNISTAQAYVADVTSPEERAKGMGMIGAAFGIGFTLGPAFAALFINEHFAAWVHQSFLPVAWSDWMSNNRYALPGFFAAALSALSFLMIVFKLPETVGRADLGDASRVARHGVFNKKFWVHFSRKNRAVGHALPLLLIGMFVLALGHSSLYSSFPLYCKSVLLLSPGQVGMQFVIMGVVTVLVQGGMIRPLVKRYGEKPLFLAGGVLMSAGLALVPFGQTAAVTSIFLGIMAVGAGLCGPTLTSLLSKEAEPAHVGAMMGTAQGMSALGRVIGPTWGGFLYGMNARWPFWITGCFMLALVWIGVDIRNKGTN